MDKSRGDTWGGGPPLCIDEHCIASVFEGYLLHNSIARH